MKELRWEHCGMDDGSSKILFQALQHCRSTRNINFEGNRIGSIGLAALAATCKFNRSLNTVDLCKNRIRDDGAKMVEDILKDNGTLTSLNLWGNRFSPKKAADIANAMQDNFAIQHLSIMPTCPPAIHEKIDVFVMLNRTGRHLMGQDDVPIGLWPHALARTSRQSTDLHEQTSYLGPTLLFHLLRAKPGLCKRATAEKRKRPD